MASNEPSHTIPFEGYVETTGDALRLIQAARNGLIPRITRRLNELERRSMIRSGAIFVFSVEESGIKRWTEGLQWSPSRISGNFLVYKEVHERAAPRGKTDIPAGSKVEVATSFKPYGLCKKTITVKIDGSDHHLVSYFVVEDIETGRLRRPTSRPDIMAIEVSPELVQSTNFRYPPQIEAGPDGRLTIIHDIEEIHQPFEETSVTARHRDQRQPSTPQHGELTPSPTNERFLHSPSEGDSRHVHSLERSISHQPVTSTAPLQEMQRFYEQGAQYPVSRPENSPQSPQMSSYSTFDTMTSHNGNIVYPSYASPTHAHSLPIQQQANWGYGTTASTHVAGHMPNTASGQHAHSMPVPDAITWGPMEHALPGQPFASAPPMPNSIASSLPTRPREHMRTRSTPSTWSMDHGHSSQLHVPVARHGHTSMPGYRGTGNNGDT